VSFEQATALVMMGGGLAGVALLRWRYGFWAWESRGWDALHCRQAMARVPRQPSLYAARLRERAARPIEVLLPPTTAALVPLSAAEVVELAVAVETAERVALAFPDPALVEALAVLNRRVRPPAHPTG
jgi:hypothetical protein